MTFCSVVDGDFSFTEEGFSADDSLFSDDEFEIVFRVEVHGSPPADSTENGNGENDEVSQVFPNLGVDEVEGDTADGDECHDCCAS